MSGFFLCIFGKIIEMKHLYLLLLFSTFCFGQSSEQFEKEILKSLEFNHFEKSYQLIYSNIKLNGVSERMNQLQQGTTYYMFMDQFAKADIKPTLFQLKSYIKSLDIDINKKNDKESKYVYFRFFTSYSLLYYGDYKKELSKNEIDSYKIQILKDAENIELNFPETKNKIVEIKSYLNRL